MKHKTPDCFKEKRPFVCTPNEGTRGIRLLLTFVILIFLLVLGYLIIHLMYQLVECKSMGYDTAVPISAFGKVNCCKDLIIDGVWVENAKCEGLR